MAATGMGALNRSIGHSSDGCMVACLIAADCVLCCRVFTFSDDEEEEKRVVRSQKDKRWVIINIHLQ